MANRSALKNPLGKSMIEYRRFCMSPNGGDDDIDGVEELKVTAVKGRKDYSIPLMAPVEEKDRVLGTLSGQGLRLNVSLPL